MELGKRGESDGGENGSGFGGKDVGMIAHGDGGMQEHWGLDEVMRKLSYGR